MKKVVSFVKKNYLLCFCILSLILLVFVFPSIEKKGTYSLDSADYVTIECPETAKAGSSITCTVKLKATGKTILGVNANYDLASKLTYKSITMTSDSGFELLSVDEDGTASSKGFAIANLTGVTTAKTLLTVKFDVASSAQVGSSYKVGLKNIELVDSVQLSDGSYEMLTADNNSVNVTIVDDATPGTEEYQIVDLIHDDDKMLITRLVAGTKYSALRSHFETTGTVKFVSSSGANLSDSSIVKTGDKVKITVTSGTVTYELSVLGDNTGDGIIEINDVGRLYKYYNHRLEFTDAQIASGDVIADNVIEINDVGRLYKFYNNKISTLEVGGK